MKSSDGKSPRIPRYRNGSSAVSHRVSHPLTAAKAKQQLLSHALEFHVEELFSHEEFVTINQYDFRAHAAVNPITAAQILKQETSGLSNDAGVRSRHVGVILEDQVTGGPAQRGFRIVELELGHNLAVQLDMFKFGTERPLLQLGDAPDPRALGGFFVE